MQWQGWRTMMADVAWHSFRTFSLGLGFGRSSASTSRVRLVIRSFVGPKTSRPKCAKANHTIESWNESKYNRDFTSSSGFKRLATRAEHWTRCVPPMQSSIYFCLYSQEPDTISSGQARMIHKRRQVRRAHRRSEPSNGSQHHSQTARNRPRLAARP